MPSALHVRLAVVHGGYCRRTLLADKRKSSEAVFRLLLPCGQVRAELGQVSGRKAWTSAQADVGANLPAFNAYPQPHVTAVGEYLMALPQMLEGLGQEDTAPASDGDDGPQGSEWLDRVRGLLLSSYPPPPLSLLPAMKRSFFLRGHAIPRKS